MWTYDLSPSQFDEQFMNPKQRRNLTLEVEFANNIASPLVLCVYQQFDSDIIINPTSHGGGTNLSIPTNFYPSIMHTLENIGFLRMVVLSKQPLYGQILVDLE